jgi:hypothetical protein
MKKSVFFAIVGLTVIAISSIAFAHASYTGYSGAPGTSGHCAALCHGVAGGTIQVTGFPAQYSAGQVYVIAVSHSGGSTIRQFNASIRVGDGTQNAGSITANTRTAIYNVGGETNGVHLSSASQNDGTFNWTAPQSGSGTVKLYLAGLQGNMSGQNSTIVLSSTEHTTGIEDNQPIPNKYLLLNNYPNPFNAQTSIKFTMPSASHVKIEIYNVLGQKVETLVNGFMGAGEHTVNWNASSEPSGVYFCRMATDTDRLMRRITLLK